MTYSKGIRFRFAELRAGGKTLSMIEKLLKVKKSILIEWEKEQLEEILKLREGIREEIAMVMEILLRARKKNLNRDNFPGEKRKK